MSDLRSQLIAKLGATPLEPEPDAPRADDALAATAHLDTDWFRALTPLVRECGMALGTQPSFAAAQNAHHVVAKTLKKTGRGRERSELVDAFSRYTKKREKVIWARLKASLTEAGQSPKLYRALKSGAVPAETLLNRWNRIKNKGWSAANIRTELLRS